MKSFVEFQNRFIFVLVCILIILCTQIASIAEFTPVSDRTSQVSDAIITAAGVNSATKVTDTHLTLITRLNLRAAGITELQSGDFSGMTGLTSLNLYGNELSSLPDGIFEGLTALTTLRLGGNTVNPMLITVSLEKVADGQFKAVVPTGAPFDIVLPISATNGSIADNTTSLTISNGSTESRTLTVTHTADTTAAVTTNIGTLPSLPVNHYGYSLSKSSDLPVETIAAVTTTEETTPTLPSSDQNVAPIFTDGERTTRSIAENTLAETNIGTAVSATDANSNTLTYSLSGTDAATFDIDTTTGQLKTKLALDYETKRVYPVTITVSDGTLTDTITVIISIIDVSETTIVSMSLPVSDRTTQVRDAIVAAVPNVTDAADVTDTHLAAITVLDLRNEGITSLQTGDFSGLTALTSLNLYGNMLSSLPYGIFEGLTSLTSLRLGGNLLEPMPLIASIQQVATGQFRVVISEGAPFDISVPVNGSSVTISQGSTASTTFTSTINVSIGTLPSLPANHYGYVLAKSAVCNRTSQVVEAIAAAVPNVTDCNNVTEVDLAIITSLDLSSKSITSLASDDFVGLLSLSTVDLRNNQLSSLPAGIFKGLTALTSVDLSGNTADPISLTVVLEKVGTNQIKAVIPTGAPFSITLPITVANGSLSSGTTLIISTGSVESTTETIRRTSNTIGAVTANIGTLPSIPSSHSGYALGKSSNLPLAIFSEINVAPIFTDGTTITRTIAENTAADTNIGSPVSATDANNDTLTYTLTGTDAASFSIVSTTGQLKTKAALDYETKTSYSVSITVSDSRLTDSISVTINITDIDENSAPVFADGDSTTRSIAENTVKGTNIGTPISATDADNDTLTYTLTGTDADTFDIISNSGQLQTKSDLDYETKISYYVTITVSDGNLTDTISVTISITDIDETQLKTEDNEDSEDSEDSVIIKNDPPNNAPMFTDGSSITRSIAENTAAAGNIGTPVSATDADNDVLTYSLEGTDATSFDIDSTSGQLKIKLTLDYNIKSTYALTIKVSDGNGGTDTINVTINVTEVQQTDTDLTQEQQDDSNTSQEQQTNNDPKTDTEQVQDDSNTSQDNSQQQQDTQTGMNEDTWITDLHLILAIRSSLNMGSEPLTQAKMLALTSLTARNASISDLTGLEYATNLTHLDIASNQITSINVLRNLTNLSHLNIEYNLVTDISVTTDLTELQYIYVAGNPITDLSPLNNRPLIGSSFPIVEQNFSIPDANLEAAIRETLDIADDTSITQNHILLLTSLTATNAQISNLSGLKHATNLTTLDLSNNQISNVYPLKDLTSLTNLNLAQNQISNLYYLNRLTNLNVLKLVGNPLETKDAAPLLLLGNLSDVDIDLPTVADVPDSTLAKVLRSALYINAEIPITQEALQTLINLDHDRFKDSNRGYLAPSIDNLSGLEYATNLTTLSLSNHGVSNLTPIQNLSQLTTLNLRNNDDISDFTPISNLTNLTSLDLTNTHISDISSLRDLTKLEILYIGGESAAYDAELSDISPLANLTELTSLNLGNTNVSNLTPLSNLTKLTRLLLQGNEISNISPLANLTELTSLYLYDNNIRDVSPLSSLINLILLYLKGNPILDTSPIYPLLVANGGKIVVIDIEVTQLVENTAPKNILSSVRPNETQLLANYPNPFNPETWIPYNLANPSNVRISIYNMQGVVVRRLEFGYQPAGYYTSRSRAAHWDGRNSLGERVACGTYCYQLQAGNMSYMRRMVILK